MSEFVVNEPAIAENSNIVTDSHELDHRVEELTFDEADINNNNSDHSKDDEIDVKDIVISTKAKEEGNNQFRLKEYDDAIESYSKAIYHCPEDEDNKDYLATFYGNRSAAYFSIEDYELVIEDCTSALELKPNYPKVLARRMQAYEKMENLDEALSDAKELQKLDPAFPKIDVTVYVLFSEQIVCSNS